MGVLFFLLTQSCVGTRACVVDLMSMDYAIPEAYADTTKLSIDLTTVATGATQPTEIVFPHHHPDKMIIAGKKGTAWLYQKDGETYAEQSVFFSVTVRSQSEQGLLGLAFHPKYDKNGLFYIHTSPKTGPRRGEISEWKIVDLQERQWKATRVRTILDIPQPYGNHNGGQLQFGPDGFLYIAMGDGGWKDDPHGHGQDLTSLLGTILRIDPTPDDNQPYQIPTDNPFARRSNVRAEIYAYGLRNPWRFSFADNNRMIVADVGQNAYEEINIVGSGDNLGWNAREAANCFPIGSNCPSAISQGYVEPIHQYAHELGSSITGGYVHSAQGKLNDKYIFGDFTSGRIWSLELPMVPNGLVGAEELGKFSILPSTFGKDTMGFIYVADFGSGDVFRIASK